MTDYISQEEVLELLKEAEYKESSLNVAGSMICAIRDLPAADVRPVVHGKLIHETIDTDSSITGKFYSPSAICSICGSRVIGNVNYCPFCGADMREEVPGHE